MKVKKWSRFHFFTYKIHAYILLTCKNEHFQVPDKEIPAFLFEIGRNRMNFRHLLEFIFSHRADSLGDVLQLLKIHLILFIYRCGSFHPVLLFTFYNKIISFRFLNYAFIFSAAAVRLSVTNTWDIYQFICLSPRETKTLFLYPVFSPLVHCSPTCLQAAQHFTGAPKCTTIHLKLL